MSKDTAPLSPQQIETGGEYSPGIVMGNFTVNQALSPAPVGLENAFKISLELRPSERGYFVDLDEGRKVFVNGCKFDMHIGNGSTTDFVLRLFRMSVKVEELAVPLLRDKERRYGALFTPHQLFIDLRREAAPGWWLLSDGMKHSEPREFEDARRDLLDSPLKPRLQFRISPGEVEVIEGGLTPREEGLFRVRFVFGIVTAAEKLSRETGEILITKGGVDHGP